MTFTRYAIQLPCGSWGWLCGLRVIAAPGDTPGTLWDNKMVASGAADRLGGRVVAVECTIGEEIDTAEQDALAAEVRQRTARLR